MKDPIKQLVRLLRLARTDAELQMLLTDLLTPAEIEDLAQRWRLTQALLEGTPQRRIKEAENVSISLVTRASAALKAGGRGFRLAYRLMQRENT